LSFPKIPIFKKYLEIKGFKYLVPFGIEIAQIQIGTKNADKAKPRVIVGRKATPACRNAMSTRACLYAKSTTACRHGSLKLGIAGLPKREKFCGARGLYFHEPFIFTGVQFILIENPKRKEIEVNGKFAEVFKR
jgi:hypothetical protein